MVRQAVAQAVELLEVGILLVRITALAAVDGLPALEPQATKV